MTSTVQKTSDTAVSISVTVSKEKIDKELDRIYRELGKSAAIPGFRKGKVPRKILAARIGIENLLGEAQGNLVPETLQEALVTHDIDPIDFEIKDIKWEGSGRLDYVAEVQIMAPFTVEGYTELTATRTDFTYNDDHVKLVVDDFCRRFAEYKVQPEGHAAAEGDRVMIALPLEAGTSTPLKRLVEIGKGAYPKTGEGLIGKKVGDSAEAFLAEVKPSKAVEGTSPGEGDRIPVTVERIDRLEVPALNPDLLKKYTKFEEVEAFYEDIRDNLRKTYDRNSTNALKDNLLSQIMEKNNITIPQPLIERGAHGKTEEFLRSLQSRGIDPKAFMNLDEKTRLGFQAKFNEEAEKEIRLQYVLKQIAAQEGLSVSDEEIDQRVEQLAADAGENAEKLKIIFQEDSRRKDISKTILFDKTIDHIIEKSEIVVEERVAPMPGAGEPEDQHEEEDHHHDGCECGECEE